MLAGSAAMVRCTSIRSTVISKSCHPIGSLSSTRRTWKDLVMTHFKVGDKVIITEGDFKGERGAITDKHVIGDGLTVALEKHGKEIKTHEAHVNKVDD
jgi:transcription antitermination factor NusG